MGLNLKRLEKVRRRGSNTIARCPACAEDGGDRKGEHLFINDGDHFGCVLYPGQDGQQHRQRIFELAGGKEIPNKGFKIRKPVTDSGASVIQKDILGRLGRLNLTPARKSSKTTINNDNFQEDLKEPVPTVPGTDAEGQSKFTFTPEEERLLAGIDAKFLTKVHLMKDVFNGTVVAVD